MHARTSLVPRPLENMSSLQWVVSRLCTHGHGLDLLTRTKMPFPPVGNRELNIFMAGLSGLVHMAWHRYDIQRCMQVNTEKGTFGLSLKRSAVGDLRPGFLGSLFRDLEVAYALK